MATEHATPPSSTTFHLAFAVSNIKNHVSVNLNQEEGHYATWVELFQITACAFNVIDHIDPKASQPSNIDKTIWKRLNLLADQLVNVDCLVSERKMIMQITTGLPPGQFDTVAAIISQSEPTPRFNKARSMFLLEETRLNKQEENWAHALVTQHFDGSTTSSTSTQPPIQ
ncbi:uncharacterized protein LOC130823371 [Amaranthus tricolor]|uniref:uncharacterized protein LOC130823371 n=1 Tax=Amaranthus tricolor TaxID=29722 RepID=UPI0025860E9B|nr:uncharacterized protein LOC130823371 [Amaranthus tricolor]